MRKILRRFFYILLLVQFAIGCGEHDDNYVKIDFRAAQWPAAVEQVTGLSGPEPWGRWMDGNVAPATKIFFKQPLPQHFTLQIVAQAIPEHGAVKVRIGAFEQDIFVPHHDGDKQLGETVEVFVDLPQPASTIEIIPTAPISPQELGINADPRKLSLGLIEVSIVNVKDK